jgi:hypothetical protein
MDSTQPEQHIHNRTVQGSRSQNRGSTPCSDSLFFSSVQNDSGGHPALYKAVMGPLSQSFSIQNMKLTTHPH